MYLWNLYGAVWTEQNGANLVRFKREVCFFFPFWFHNRLQKPTALPCISGSPKRWQFWTMKKPWRQWQSFTDRLKLRINQHGQYGVHFILHKTHDPASYNQFNFWTMKKPWRQWQSFTDRLEATNKPTRPVRMIRTILKSEKSFAGPEHWR